MRLNYYSCGEGLPFVILHGLFGLSDNWQTLSRRFKQHCRVFALDLRNHGNSPHDKDVGYPAMARDLAEFLDEQQIGEAFILGHSMGGKVAMQFGNDYPAASFVTIKGAGHWLHAEKPEDFYEVVHEFLAREVLVPPR